MIGFLTQLSNSHLITLPEKKKTGQKKQTNKQTHRQSALTKEDLWNAMDVSIRATTDGFFKGKTKSVTRAR